MFSNRLPTAAKPPRFKSPFCTMKTFLLPSKKLVAFLSGRKLAGPAHCATPLHPGLGYKSFNPRTGTPDYNQLWRYKRHLGYRVGRPGLSPSGFRVTGLCGFHPRWRRFSKRRHLVNRGRPWVKITVELTQNIQFLWFRKGFSQCHLEIKECHPFYEN